MGDAFTPKNMPQKDQQIWVPRSTDLFGRGNQGHNLVGFIYGQEILYSDLAITDTTAHPSAAPTPTTNNGGSVIDQVYALTKTVVLLSTQLPMNFVFFVK